MPRGKETRANNDGVNAGLGSRGATKGMNLKGEGSVSAIGRCVSVLYDEGEPSLVAYRGVVVYLEHSRCVATRCAASTSAFPAAAPANLCPPGTLESRPQGRQASNPKTPPLLTDSRALLAPSLRLALASWLRSQDVRPL